MQAGMHFGFTDQLVGDAPPPSARCAKECCTKQFRLGLKVIEMKPGRTFSLLTGIALLGALAIFNEMTPNAQASFFAAAAATVQSLLQSTVATYRDITDKR